MSRRSGTLRFTAYVYGAMGGFSMWVGVIPEAYVAMFVIVGAVFAVGGEILRELGR